MYLIGDKIILRAIEERDLELLRKLINDSEIQRETLGWSLPVSEYHQKQWFYNSRNDNSSIRWVISTQNGKALGIAMLSNIDWKNRSSNIGIKLVQSEQGKGIGSESYKLIIDYAFGELQMNRIEAEVIEYNISSIKLHEKLGFLKEGVKRKRIFQKGKYHNTVILSLLASN